MLLCRVGGRNKPAEIGGHVAGRMGNDTEKIWRHQVDDLPRELSRSADRLAGEHDGSVEEDYQLSRGKAVTTKQPRNITMVATSGNHVWRDRSELEQSTLQWLTLSSFNPIVASVASSRYALTIFVYA